MDEGRRGRGRSGGEREEDEVTPKNEETGNENRREEDKKKEEKEGEKDVNRTRGGDENKIGERKKNMGTEREKGDASPEEEVGLTGGRWRVWTASGRAAGVGGRKQ